MAAFQTLPVGVYPPRVLREDDPWRTLLALEGVGHGPALGRVGAAPAVAGKVPLTLKQVLPADGAQLGRRVPREDLVALLDWHQGLESQDNLLQRTFKLDMIEVFNKEKTTLKKVFGGIHKGLCKVLCKIWVF